MSKTVRFDGRPVDRLIAFDHELAGGSSVEMTDDEAAQLAADPHVSVTVTTATSPRPTPARGATTEKHHEED